MAKSFLISNEIPITQDITILIPTVGQILENELEYYSLVQCFTATPWQRMVQLYMCKPSLDWTEFNDYTLFQLYFEVLRNSDVSMLFKDLSFKYFFPCKDEKDNIVYHQFVHKETGESLDLYDKNTHLELMTNIESYKKIEINELIFNLIADKFRKLHLWEKDIRHIDKTGNFAEHNKQYFMEREVRRWKKEQREAQNKSSQLEKMIIGLVNEEKFKYDFEGVMNLSIYAFNKSYEQICHAKNNFHILQGVYSGTINYKELDVSSKFWIDFSK